MGETILLAAGGTGGHVFPGLATADALRRARPDLDIVFVGTADRLEARLVPEAGWRLHTVPAMALRKDLSLLRLPGVLGRAVASVRRLMRSTDVIAAVCFGGYTSVPLALAARMTGTPLVVHEQNAIPGRANRLAARGAAAVAVSFPEASDGFGAVRTVLTGNPVRPGIMHPAEPDASSSAAGDRRRSAREHFGLLPDRPTLLVFGGSQGAQRINTALTGSAGAWGRPEAIQILHAAGTKTFAATKQAWEDAAPSALHVVVVAFIEEMALAYAAADVVVCRAGASSIAELTALGLPSVLVPYPYATDDHQTANARGLAAAGGAVVVADAELDATRLVSLAEPLLTDSDARARMAAAAAEAGRPDAADALAALALEVAHR